MNLVDLVTLKQAQEELWEALLKAPKRGMQINRKTVKDIASDRWHVLVDMTKDKKAEVLT